MKNKIFLALIIFIVFFLGSALAQENPQSAAPQPQPDSLPRPADSSKISLDIKGMDIVDVLKMLATRSGMSIVVGKNVTGRVSLFLKEVDIWDAFEIILLANELAYETKGQIINVMTQRDYELLYGERYFDKKEVKLVPLKYAKAEDLAKALNQIKSNIGRIVVDQGSNTLALIDTPAKVKAMEDFIRNTDIPIQTRIFSLNYAQAEKLQPKIQDTLTKGVGFIKTDERTNKIAVTDYPQKLDEIANIVSAFDEKTQQVLIDAQIIEIKPSDTFEMGVDWNYWLEKYFQVKASLPIGTDNRLILGTTSSAPTRSGQYKAILDILRTIGDTKILSSPRIMAINNQEAKIMVGTKDAYITSTTSQAGTGSTVTSQSVNFVDVGIKLYVTPTVNRDGFVTMKIKPEISSAKRTDITSEGQVTQIPIVTTSETETTVMVKDGVTIIIGGLRKDSRDKTVKKIPLIGDIPGLGAFFRSTSDASSKTELVILLTPHIMSGEDAYTDFSAIRPKDGAMFKMVEGDIVGEKITPLEKKESPGPIPEAAFAYYCLVNDKIQKLAARYFPRVKKGEVSLNFSISAKGKLIGEPQVLDATDASLIPFALRAVKRAAPFPVFPPDLKKTEERFYITLRILPDS